MKVKHLFWVVPALGLFSLGAADRGPSLIDSIKAGDTAAAHTLIGQHVDVNIPAVDGTTALEWAVYRDDLETTDLLIRAGAKVGAVNHYGVAPLSLACTNGNGAMVEKLLKAGADPNTTQSGGETALMTAARTGKVDAVKALLAHGANVNAKESWKGQTALMWAAAEGNAGAVKALIDAGAEINARSNPTLSLSVQQPGNKGFTALLFAIRAGRIEAVRTLLGAGASVNDKLSDGTSGLVVAVASAQFDMAAFLLDNGADPNAAAQGWSALHQIVYVRRPNRGYNTVGPVPRGQMDSLRLVKKLIEHKANVNAVMTQQMRSIYTGRSNLNQIGATPFFLAAHRVDVELMHLLVANGADPLLGNEDHTTPLMAAAGVGLWFPGESPGTPEEAADAVKMCLELGGDAKTVDANGETALHGAAYWDSPGAVELLAAAGAKLDALDERGWTPLRIADGVTITASLHGSPATAALLRKLLKEQGLPVPDPIFGDGGRKGYRGLNPPPGPDAVEPGSKQGGQGQALPQEHR